MLALRDGCAEDASNHVRALRAGMVAPRVERVGRATAILASMRIAMLGLGLIGGSVVRALRDPVRRRRLRSVVDRRLDARGRGPPRPPSPTVSSTSPRPPPEAAIEGADLVVLAGPAPDCLAQLDELAGAWRGVLAPEAVDHRCRQHQGGHRAARDGARHPVRRRPSDGRARDERLRRIQRRPIRRPAVGRRADRAMPTRSSGSSASRSPAGLDPSRLGAAAHDRAVPGSATCPHRCCGPRRGGRRRTGRGGVAGLADGCRPGRERLADTTRLARGDVTMGAGIIATNAPGDRARVRELIAALEAWLVELERRAAPTPRRSPSDCDARANAGERCRDERGAGARRGP